MFTFLKKLFSKPQPVQQVQPEPEPTLTKEDIQKLLWNKTTRAEVKRDIVIQYNYRHLCRDCIHYSKEPIKHIQQTGLYKTHLCTLTRANVNGSSNAYDCTHYMEKLEEKLVNKGW